MDILEAAKKARDENIALQIENNNLRDFLIKVMSEHAIQLGKPEPKISEISCWIDCHLANMKIEQIGE